MTYKCLFTKWMAWNGRIRMNVNMCDTPGGKPEEVVAGTVSCSANSRPGDIRPGLGGQRLTLSHIPLDRVMLNTKELMHCHCGTTIEHHGGHSRTPANRGETRCPGGVSVSYLASHTRHECPRHNERVSPSQMPCTGSEIIMYRYRSIRKCAPIFDDCAVHRRS